MYTITVKSEFSGAHNLRAYKGKCENLHGHNWKVEAEIRSESLDKTGMVIDFKEARKTLNAILDRLDHKYLNNVPFFKKHNPTSENMARYIYEELEKKIKGVSLVTVWETDNSSAGFSR